MRQFTSRFWWRLAIPSILALPLAGCIPDERTESLTYSPDGKKLAVVSDRQGLRILNLVEGGMVRLPAVQPAPGRASWSPSGGMIAVVTQQFGSQDVVVSDLEGSASLLSDNPQRDEAPEFLTDLEVLYVSSPAGQRRFMRASVGQNNPEPVGMLRSYPVISWSLSPDRKFAAYTSMVDLRPQVILQDLSTGREELITSQVQPLQLITDHGPQWHPKSSEVLVLMDPRSENDVKKAVELAESEQRDPLSVAQVPSEVSRISLRDRSQPQKLSLQSPLNTVRYLPDGSGILYSADGELRRRSFQNRREKVLAFEKFRVGSLDVRRDGQSLAFTVENHLLATAAINLDRARFLFIDATDKLLLAEEYFQRGSSARTMDLYKELAESVTSADPDHANFVFLANMVRLGRTREAVESLERLVANEGLPAEVPREAIWRVLGFAYYLDLNEPARAQFCLNQADIEYRKRQQMEASLQQARETGRWARRILGLMSASPFNADTDRWANLQMGHQLTSSTLEILATGNKELTDAYRAALRDRLGADVASTIRSWGRLLALAPESPAVHREYIRALDGFDQEVYYFSPSTKPFRPTRNQRATFLEQFLTIVPVGEESDRARLELFLLSVETRNFTRARNILLASLDRDEERGIEGIPEAFEDFLEKPETQPWLEPAMVGVFLEPSVRARLEKLLTDPEPAFLMALAATKSALLRGDLELARREADTAAAIYGRVPEDDRSRRIRYFHARLLTMRAREAALRGLFGEAITQLERAADDLLDAQADDVEYLFEVQFAAGLMKDRIRENDSAYLVQRTRREAEFGDDLVAPNWDVARLRNTVVQSVTAYDNAQPNTMARWLATYDAGIAYGKLRMLDASHACLESLASQTEVPSFLRNKALVELAALEELQDDPYNAARRWATMATDDRNSGEYIRGWLGFRIAKAHLRIRYKVGEAKAALATIKQQLPDTALAYESEEILRTLDGSRPQ